MFTDNHSQVSLQVLVAFLPYELRMIRRTGIELWTLHFWHNDLSPLVGLAEAYPVHYDPRDNMHVYVTVPTKGVVIAKCVTPGVAPMSWFEHRFLRKNARLSAEDPANVALVDAGIQKRDDLVDKSKRATRAAHKRHSFEELRRAAAKHFKEHEPETADEQPDSDDSPDLEHPSGPPKVDFLE